MGEKGGNNTIWRVEDEHILKGLAIITKIKAQREESKSYRDKIGVSRGRDG